MCTNPRGRGTITAADVQIGGIYETCVAEGVVTVFVSRELPRDLKARNKLFECVDLVTNRPLPKPKRAEDLDPWRSPFFRSAHVVLPFSQGDSQ